MDSEMDPRIDPKRLIKGRMVQNTLNPLIQKGLTDPETGGLLIQMKIQLETHEIAKRADRQ